MDAATLKSRIQTLVAKTRQQPTLELLNELQQGTLTLMNALYGPSSSQENVWRASLDQIRADYRPNKANILIHLIAAIRGALQTMLEEVDSGFIGSLRDAITGEVLSDLVKLSRKVLEESSGKDVAAVLTAAAFEDTIRRLSTKYGIADHEKLADILEELKKQRVLQGAQVGIAQSYLSFRNKALHAKWGEVDLSAVESALAFTEQLLLKHFS